MNGSPQAKYELSVPRQKGRWHILAESAEGSLDSKVVTEFDYRLAKVRGHEGSVRDLLERHTVNSVALSAILLWEDYQANRMPEVVWPPPKYFFDVEKQHGDEIPETDDYDNCGVCTPQPNGCTAVPDNCPPFSTQTILESCQEHDRCYQCGAACFDRSRSDCDSRFRTNVTAQANGTCAYIYYLGVRALGWLFYQTDSGGVGFMHDVYSLGVTLSACEGQYSHMCTTYVF